MADSLPSDLGLFLSLVFMVVAVAWYFVYTRARSRDEGDSGVLHEYLL